MSENKPRKLTRKERVVAIWNVAKITYRASPGAVIMQLARSIVDAILPIVTTYFAALTTTELVAAVEGVPGAEIQTIIYVVITASFGVIMMIWSSIERYVMQVMQYKIEAAISDKMYEHFLALDFWRYDDKETKDVYDKASQFARFFPYVFDRLSSVVSQIIGLIAAVIAIALVNWILGIIILLAVIPNLLIQVRLSRLQIDHWNGNVETRRARGMLEWEILRPESMAELRIYGVIRHLLGMRKKYRDKDDRQRIDFERQFIWKRLGADILQSVVELGALIWTVFQIIDKTLPIGHFIYIQQMVSRVMSSANGFVTTLSNLDEDLANLFDYQQFMAMPAAQYGTKTLPSVPAEIEFNNVSFHYPQNDVEVLKGVSLTIRRGQHIAIVGENGAGKSTFIKLLTGLYAPSEGSVLFDGTPIEEFDISEWHRHLGVLQQEFIMYSFASARDNVYFGDVLHRFNEERFSEAVKNAQAKKFLEKLPNSYDTFVSTWMEDDHGHKGVDLSGGQRQRLALARNFYRDNEVIILDEPTSAIDAAAEEKIFKHLFRETNKTVVTISHRLNTVKRADVIYVLEAGVLVEQGTHEELVAKQGAYYRMFESQL